MALVFALCAKPGSAWLSLCRVPCSGLGMVMSVWVGALWAGTGLEQEDRVALAAPNPCGHCQWDGPCAEHWEDGDEIRYSLGGQINK